MVRTQLRGDQITDQSVDDQDLDFGLGTNQISDIDIPTDTTNFDNNLSVADDTVQKALDTLDDLDVITYAEEAIIASHWDDFVWGDTATKIGELGWAQWQIGSNFNILYVTPDANSAGVVRLSTKATVSNGGTIGTANVRQFPAVADMLIRIRLRVLDLTLMCFRVGCHTETTLTTAPTEGIYFERDTSVDTKLYAVCADNNVRTKVDTGITMVANTWYRMEAKASLDGNSILFYVQTQSGSPPYAAPTLVATITTNIPKTAARSITAANTIIARSNATRTIDIDYYLLKIPLLVR